ncbi:MAG TPA: hypothetical protein VH988_17505 [Thermoanaerobaculia bacterium]|nr:hypothetical protein [Thermoanaerobaculia bacterium]
MDDPQAHVTEEEVQWFVDGTLAPERRRALLEHLLSRCSECLRRTAVLAPFCTEGDEPPPVSVSAADIAAYDDVVGRCFRVASAAAPRGRLEDEQRNAFLAKVGADDSIEQILAKADPAMLIRPLVEALLTLSFTERARHPGRMLALARVAVTLAANLPRSKEAGLYSPKEAADLRARAWVELANAYRRNDDFPAADEALERAERLQAAGTGEPLLLARLLDVLASLRTDERRFEEAYVLLDLIYNIYMQIGESHFAGRALLNRGFGFFYYDGNLERAADTLRQSLSLLDPDRDPQLLAIARHNLLLTLAASGEYTEAAELLLRSGLREALPEPLNQLKIRWLEARIYAGLGKHALAEGAFREIQAGFTSLCAEYEAALVRLELAGVLLHDPTRTEEIAHLADEAYATFEFLEVGREALRAVRCLQSAYRTGEATASLVREVVCFLERFEARPGLRFRD